MKKFLIVTNILLAVALVAVIAVFVYISSTLQSAQSNQVAPVEKTQSTEPGASQETDYDVPAAGIPLKDANLSDSQKKTLETVGVDTENFVITPAMISCGAEKLGDDRMMEIAGGAAPTALETARLLPCLGAE